MSKTLVIALGGNAFIKKGEPNTPEYQWRNVRIAAKQIANLYSNGYNIVVTHGNGPQVGIILEWTEAMRNKRPPLTMDVATAMTQGWLGYMLTQTIGNELVSHGFKRKIVSLVNQVLVDNNDPAFSNPTKFIGSYYTDEETRKLSKEKGWVMKRDPRGGYRRVVSSPMPRLNIEHTVIQTLLNKGYIVVASGGGGIPVVEENGLLKGVEAVIDKDLASMVLAVSIRAGGLVIATDVEGVYLNYGSPNAELLRKTTVSKLRELYENGEFPPGSMGPKILACIKFVEKTGNWAVIGSLEHLEDAVNRAKGTFIHS
ncbi:MAG: carbamate kinase [Desulfurococcales archaeon]|nr:carbamate kinase [Desulfurococcales archaeon]